MSVTLRVFKSIIVIIVSRNSFQSIWKTTKTTTIKVIIAILFKGLESTEAQEFSLRKY